MSSVIIVFASMTGNTEEMADAFAKGLREAGIEPVVKSVVDANAAELAKYDGILLGAYTWGDGELPDDFLDFYEELDEVDLNGRKALVFGSADSSYSEFGAAVDILVDKLKERGADVIQPGLKVELNPSKDEKEKCKQLGQELAQAISG